MSDFFYSCKCLNFNGASDFLALVSKPFTEHKFLTAHDRSYGYGDPNADTEIEVSFRCGPPQRHS